MNYAQRPLTLSPREPARIPWAATWFTSLALAVTGSLLAWRSAPEDAARHLRSWDIRIAGADVVEAPIEPREAASHGARQPEPTDVQPFAPFPRTPPSASSGAKPEVVVPSVVDVVEQPAPTTGMLMVYMRGGTCKFELDGAPAGNGSSFQREVAVGTHRVVCYRNGLKRIKSVVVDGGSGAVLRFSAE